jgi:hypothetical protein
MQMVLTVLLWILFLAGGLPASGQRLLENRLPWWHPRLMGLLSSLVEAFCGWQMLRGVLFQWELSLIPLKQAVPLGLAGGFLLLEGLLRTGVTIKPESNALPSLPVAAAWKALAARFGKTG